VEGSAQESRRQDDGEPAAGDEFVDATPTEPDGDSAGDPSTSGEDDYVPV
jgi:hypothetical protein